MKHVYLNGKFYEPAKAKVSVFDKGFNFGGGLYEVIRAYNGRAFFPELHYARLMKGASVTGLKIDFSLEGLLKIFEKLSADGKYKDGIFYLQVTFGAETFRNNELKPNLSPTVLISYQKSPGIPPAWKQKGIKIKTQKDSRWGHCSVKSINLLPNLIDLNHARNTGYADVLYFNRGRVMECASCNIFFILQGKVITPKKSKRILPGITRHLVLELLNSLKIPHLERTFSLSELGDCEGAFVSSTTKGIIPVCSIDDLFFRKNKLSLKLHTEFEKFRQDYFKT
ncbi:aminotransferase class IV [Candidatus Riflebacteria bacterium]